MRTQPQHHSPSSPSSYSYSQQSKPNSTQSRTHHHHEAFHQHQQSPNLHTGHRQAPSSPSLTEQVQRHDQEILIYGQRFELDLSSYDSVVSFLSAIEETPRLSQRTRLSLKLVVLDKGLPLNKGLMQLHSATLKEY